MGKNHLKRLAAPKTWHLSRKTNTFIIKSLPGPHRLGFGMPLGVILRDLLKYANTMREVRKILNNGEIKIDGIVRKNFRFPVGVFDTLEFTGIDEHFRVMLSKKGSIELIKITKEDSSAKPCKITGKTMVKGRLQLSLYDGRTILADKNSYKVGDTIVLSLPGNRISKHLKLEKKSAILLTGGKHIGEMGYVDDIIENRIIYKDEKNELVETSKDYAFVVGDDKPLIKLQ